LQHDASFEARVPDDAAERLLDRAADDLHPDALVALELEPFERLLAADERDAAAGDDAFLDGGAGGSASSTRAFFSFISVSVAAPTCTTATPPTSLASRSWSFSRS
jgi:hypothetical protein